MTDPPLEIRRERDGRLLRLRLNRPKANVIDAEMIAALDAAFAGVVENPDILAVLLDHAGAHFSFGASVEEHLPERCAAMLESLHALIKRMLACPVPILVAVRGQCLGGGLEVAMAGSLIFVAPDAMLGQPEIKLAVFAPAAAPAGASTSPARPITRRSPAARRWCSISCPMARSSSPSDTSSGGSDAQVLAVETQDALLHLHVHAGVGLPGALAAAVHVEDLPRNVI